MLDEAASIFAVDEYGATNPISIRPSLECWAAAVFFLRPLLSPRGRSKGRGKDSRPRVHNDLENVILCFRP